MRKPVVIDTNVLVVANAAPEHSRLCALNCMKRLKEIQATGQVVLDSGWEVLAEYAKNQPTRSQPGVGYQFWKWLLNNTGNADRCSWVNITRNDSRGYTEFPTHDGLTQFDPSDRKFVALSIAHGSYPPILQATDSKWMGWKRALVECGVSVEFLCKAEIQRKYEDKLGRRSK
jgi:hypothetical protein